MLTHADVTLLLFPAYWSVASKGSNSEWGNVLKQHERRKWSCLSALLPAALAEPGIGGGGGGVSVPGVRTAVQQKRTARTPVIISQYQTQALL